MANLEQQILELVDRSGYQPQKPRALARKLGIATSGYPEFKEIMHRLVERGRIELGKGHLVRPARQAGLIAGIFRRTSTGTGFVRPHPGAIPAGPEIFIRASDGLDAATGDEVLVKLKKKAGAPGRGPSGVVVRVVERETRKFVGTYFERDGDCYVRVDSNLFSHSVLVGDPGAKNARPGDKVVIEMIHFPSPDERGEGVLVEVLGREGQPGIDTLSIIRQFDLPDIFPEDALSEARVQAEAFDEKNLEGREDLTGLMAVTIDPIDAKDFDDAISLSVDPESKHWQLSVHIADVGHFAQPGGALDREARKRGTSVYLPGRVVPMFPELIANGLASLQQGRVRFVKTARIDFTPAGQRAHVSFAEAAIRVRRRFHYEEVSEFLKAPDNAGQLETPLAHLLTQMNSLAQILRKRRLKRGALELTMQEAELELTPTGAVSGAHFRTHDKSHEMIEEFMLAANEAVAEHLAGLGVDFLRRIHPAPEPNKLEVFADFARTLGYRLDKHVDRFSLQRVLQQATKRPDIHAVNYALLRSLKQAVYSPAEEEHYALASKHYCHFTSPIRRYPDLTVHRLLGQWLQTRRAGSDAVELAYLGQHCSKTERRAEKAERELVKVKLLAYMSERIGIELPAVITGVADYGFFAQAIELPVEGLVHVSTLQDDYYFFEERGHSLEGRQSRKRYRLGDRIHVRVVRVDQHRRQMDFQVVEKRERKRQ